MGRSLKRTRKALDRIKRGKRPRARTKRKTAVSKKKASSPCKPGDKQCALRLKLTNKITSSAPSRLPAVTAAFQANRTNIVASKGGKSVKLGRLVVGKAGDMKILSPGSGGGRLLHVPADRVRSGDWLKDFYRWAKERL